MTLRSMTQGTLVFPIIFVLLVGCSNTKGFKTIEGDPERLYKEGLTLFNKRNYPDALKKFEELKSGFPDSPPYSTWAELKVGDCHFLSGSYVEAVAAYEEFKKVHPTHEEIPYVQYQVGMSHFNQMEGLDRDQTPTRKALSSFEYLIANYPTGLFSQKAKEKIGVCKGRLADQEFYVGNYYYKRGKFLAAAGRFEGLLIEYPKIGPEDKTLFLLGKSYLELNKTEMAKATFTRLTAEYPKSSHYKEAKAILDRGIKKNDFSNGVGSADPAWGERMNVALVRFEEEARKGLSLAEERKLPAEAAEKKGAPSPDPVVSPATHDVPPKNERVTGSDEPVKVALIPSEEGRKGVLPDPKFQEIIPIRSPAPSEKRKPPQGVDILGDLKREKIDTGQPIDITSDKVESFTKENLIVFKGNVTARQKDIVIYADSVEAIIIENGKGIEKVVADGRVKVQQGLRVANCEKAVFYNLEKKVILTGNPNLWDGDNMVSGEEIVFDIEQNRVDVKGGSGGRGKAKIQP